LRLRFEERELTLLKGAEQLRGVALAQNARPQVLRTALNLAKAGHKTGVAAPGRVGQPGGDRGGAAAAAVRFARTKSVGRPELRKTMMRGGVTRSSPPFLSSSTAASGAASASAAS